MAVGRGIHGCIPSGLTVMLIDEDPFSLLFLSTMLKVCHFTVESFGDAVKALSTLCMRRGEFDLVISDIHMLSMSAFKLVSCIVMQIGIPVITTAADDDPEFRRKAFMHGACFHLAKPITLADMDVVWQKAWGNEANISAEVQTDPAFSIAFDWIEVNDCPGLDGPETAETENADGLNSFSRFAFDLDPHIEGFPFDEAFLTNMLDGANARWSTNSG